jgi:glutathione S-transferase
MRALGIPFNEVVHPFAPGSNRESFRAFSPNGKVPCLIDGGTAVWDSLAIVEYLAERHAGVWPADPVARAWARCAAAEMHSGFAVLRGLCSMNCGVRVRLHSQPPDLLLELERLAELWNEGLARFGGPFLAGPQLGAVDAFYAPVAFRIQTYGLPVDAAAAAYAARLLACEPMRQWYEAALREPWRDEAHDAETRSAGTWTADFRSAVV